MSWYNEKGKDSEYVISSRVRLARNIRGFKFPNSMSADEAHKVIESVCDALNPIISDFRIYKLWEMNDSAINALVEKHLISPAFRKGIRCAVVSKDENISVMINEEDHIRIQCFAAGREISKALDLCKKIDTLLAEKLTFAYDDKYGYLTACPTNCGTALRLSAMVHLPALVMGGYMKSVAEECRRYGMTVRGIYGEESKAEGAVYQVSNQCSLGLNTDDILKRFNAMISYIIKLEDTRRIRIKEKISPEITDNIYRSLGVLKSAYMMSDEEYIKLASNVKLGIYLSILKGDADELTRLWIETSPSVLCLDDPTARDIKRAQIVKERIVNINV